MRLEFEIKKIYSKLAWVSNHIETLEASSKALQVRHDELQKIKPENELLINQGLLKDLKNLQKDLRDLSDFT